ncbi:MAG: helix-turn-helix domain-containing protein [Ruminococcus sp.]|nr:helix-turn-helix domain-containing protein [Ruminococcus sp.]
MQEYTHEQIKYEQNTGMLMHIAENDGAFTNKHWHNGFEIIYVTDGEMTVGVRDSEYRLGSGGFAVINCKTIHSAYNKGHCRNLLLQIPYETIRKNIPDIDSIMIRCIFTGRNNINGKYVLIKDILEKLEKLYTSEHDCGYLLKLNSLVYELLYLLVMNFRAGTDPELKKKTDRNVQRLGVVLQYVRQHYSENISLSHAASLVALNKEYFSRFFKKYMGQTFMDYVFSVRLECAYYDILNTDYTIGEIASKCGFENNYRLFVNKFRQMYGCNPAEKRVQIHEKDL